MGRNQSKLERIYSLLKKSFGPQHWWPGETRTEIIIGAILTQNTNWVNVEKALANLKRADCLSLDALAALPHVKLSALIKPSGFFRLKAQRLKNFVHFIFDEYGGDLRRMQAESLCSLRDKILSVNGIGSETADSILLYAFQKPVFVVDAYTKRIFSRHGLIKKSLSYEDTRAFFEKHLVPDEALYNEFHALIVRLGKEFCHPRPLCAQCVLRRFKHSEIDGKGTARL